MEEQQLIKGCNRKENKAQKQLFETYYRGTYHVAMRYLANHHDTEDVLIISFSKIFNHINKFEYRGEGSLLRWIKTIVINESLRFLSQKKKLKYEEENEGLYFNSMVAEIDTIDVEEVYLILESMPVGYRTVFNLFALEGFAHKEIASMLNISENTSKSQLNKARNYIINKLEKKIKYGIKQSR
ncbi:sigma-70 family RNA polymerase sigma factor [soil metagenome]